MNRILPFVLLSGCLILLGCGGGNTPLSYANVSGTVNYNGKPLPKGTITFASDGRPPTQMDIVDGSFSGQAVVGSNRISISAKKKGERSRPLPPEAAAQIKAYSEGRGPPGSGAGGGQPMEDGGMVEMLPPEWNSASKQMRVVEAGATNKFEFDIKGK